jgi:hypothetical protein
MTRKGFWPAMLAVFVLFWTGCDFDSVGSGYTFEFKVENTGGISALRKIEFFNGSSVNAPLLRTEETNIPAGQMSGVYKVSGFTEKDGDDKRLYGIRITTEGGNTYFKYNSATNNSKILSSLQGPIFVWWISAGTW